MAFVRPTEQRQNKLIVSILSWYTKVAKAHSSQIMYKHNQICNYRDNYHNLKCGYVTNKLEYVCYKRKKERMIIKSTKYATDRGDKHYITREILGASIMMVTTMHMLLNFKQPIFKQHYLTIITKTTKVVILEAIDMEKQANIVEVQHAVDHIPGPSNTCAELRALDKFISTQTSEPSAQVDVSTSSTEVSQQNQATSATVERYKYDPINDCMKVIDNTAAPGVGKGKQTQPTGCVKTYGTFERLRDISAKNCAFARQLGSFEAYESAEQNNNSENFSLTDTSRSTCQCVRGCSTCSRRETTGTRSSPSSGARSAAFTGTKRKKKPVCRLSTISAM